MDILTLPKPLKPATRHQRSIRTTAHAVVIKRFGRISADDFLFFAQQLLARSQQVLLVQSSMSLNRLVVDASSLEPHHNPNVDVIDLRPDINRQEFKNLFTRAPTVTLQLSKLADPLQLGILFLEWDRQRPRYLFLHTNGSGLAVPKEWQSGSPLRFKWEFGIHRYKKRLDRYAAMQNSIMWYQEKCDQSASVMFPKTHDPFGIF